IPDSGDSPQAITHLEKGEAYHIWPEYLPGATAVLFTSGAAANQHIVAYAMKTGERRDLLQGSYPRYARSGHLIYAQAGTLMAVPFDAERLQFTGASVSVVENVFQDPGGSAQYSISNTGSLVYVSGSAGAVQRKLVWVTRKGMEQA